MTDSSAKNAALAFLRQLWPEGIPTGASLVLANPAVGGFNRARDIAEAAALIACGVYACFACALMREGAVGRGHAEDAITIPGVWLDLDLKEGDHAESALPTRREALAFLDTLPLAPTLVLHSGGGLYVWWLLREPWFFENEAERNRAAQTVSGWQRFVLDQAAALGWRLDNTASLAQLLRAEGASNTKYDPPRVVRRIRDDGPRWNPSDFEEWISSARGAGNTRVELPADTPRWIACAARGLGGSAREIKHDGKLHCVTLQYCPACGGVQRTKRGLAQWTSHIAPVSGFLRCKRQTCEARESTDGGIPWEEWTRRFLSPECAVEAIRLRDEDLARLPERISPLPVLQERGPTIGIAESDNGKLGEIIDDAIEYAQSGRRIALVELPPGAGKTRQIVERLKPNHGAYFARNHDLLAEVADELERRGVAYTHIQGVGRACHFQDAYEHYGRRPDWRGSACQTCPHKVDGTCAAWADPVGVILAPHDSLPVLRDMRVNDESTGARTSVLSDRLVVVDEGPEYVNSTAVSRERIRGPLNNPGCFGQSAKLAENVTSLIDSLLARALRDRQEHHAGEHPTRYTFMDLSVLWQEVVAGRDPVRVHRTLREASNFPHESWPKPDGQSLRDKKLETSRLPHPDVRKVWRALLGAVTDGDEARLARQRHGHLEVVATDEGAWIEIRTPWRIPMRSDKGVVLLDATGQLTLAELKAANPGATVREFAVNVVPSAEAKILRAHVRTKNVTRRRLVDKGKCSDRAMGTLRNALQEVARASEKHLGPGAHSCGLITYKPIADRLAKNDADLASVVPATLLLPVERVCYYGRDDRGSNRLTGVDVLVTFGDPIPNIGATEADARALDLPPNELVGTRTAATLLQSQARSRALRAKGPVVVAHVGSITPPDSDECLRLELPAGRPARPERRAVEWLVEGMLANGEIVAEPLVEAVLQGRLPVPGPLAESANYPDPVGTFCQCSPPARRTLSNWVRSTAEGLGALRHEVRFPTGTSWAVWGPPLMPLEEAEAKATEARRAIQAATSKPLSVDVARTRAKENAAFEAELRRILERSSSPMALEEWLERYAERAAILEFDAGLPRDAAERMAEAATLEALAEIVARAEVTCA